MPEAGEAWRPLDLDLTPDLQEVKQVEADVCAGLQLRLF